MGGSMRTQRPSFSRCAFFFAVALAFCSLPAARAQTASVTPASQDRAPQARITQADADLQAVTNWLSSQGFSDIKIGAGRTALEFSGNVASVRRAFHTEIHRYSVNGEEHFANATDPQVPAALSPVAAGLVSLHNFG